MLQTTDFYEGWLELTQVSSRSERQRLSNIDYVELDRPLIEETKKKAFFK